ncbi:beta-1,3-galactosyl-O-glycosyl-glycoprotein beta-1,6-N-acetylglucosaminyltransferase 4 [Petromyzon marinus]|uniref:beta-1,3-galactosyl-O-glycosyl-glycoprotein beta-1,6-N-acetylglucosaminyltransferase 4 n=1 Tax=Petromyzon marinus TaxID=7757 RepID=UPI003F713702
MLRRTMVKRNLCEIAKLWRQIMKVIILVAVLLSFLIYAVHHTDDHSDRLKDMWLMEPSLSTSKLVQWQISAAEWQAADKELYNIRCSEILQQDPREIGKTLKIRRKTIVDLTDEDMLLLTEDCPVFLETRKYFSKHVSPEERDFPIAYSIVVHKNAATLERLLRAIFVPQNVYCIHVDTKSSTTFKSAVQSLAKCFDNVFVASKLEEVHYAHISRLQADINCLADLLKSPVRWKYAINLCGQDFPLRSNRELVSELKSLQGRSMLETGKPSAYKQQRFTHKFVLERRDSSLPALQHTQTALAPAPHGLEVFVGSAYFVLSREFVRFAITSAVAADFLRWCADTYSPDEHFWATLARSPQAPGGGGGGKADVSDLQSKTRLVKWSYLEGRLYPVCSGRHVRSVCIYGAAELGWLLRDGHWFANKFDPHVDPVVVKCLEEEISSRQNARE